MNEYRRTYYFAIPDTLVHPEYNNKRDVPYKSRWCYALAFFFHLIGFIFWQYVWVRYGQTGVFFTEDFDCDSDYSVNTPKTIPKRNDQDMNSSLESKVKDLKISLAKLKLKYELVI